MLNIEEELLWCYGRHGFCGMDTVRNMYNLSIQEKPKLAVEVGVFGGRSMFPVALGCHVNGFGEVHAIDAWSNAAASEGPQGVYEGAWKTYDFESRYQEVMRDSVKPPYDRIVKVVRAHLIDIAESYQDGSIDFFHEDANHSPNIVRASIVKWLPKIRSGGLFVWDDPGWDSNDELVRDVHSNMGLSFIEHRDGHDILRKNQ